MFICFWQWFWLPSSSPSECSSHTQKNRRKYSSFRNFSPFQKHFSQIKYFNFNSNFNFSLKFSPSLNYPYSDEALAENRNRGKAVTKTNAKVAATAIVIANGLRCYSRGFMSSVAFAGAHRASQPLLNCCCCSDSGQCCMVTIQNINLYLNVCCCIRTFYNYLNTFLNMNEMLVTGLCGLR